jgi:hypothetical protein
MIWICRECHARIHGAMWGPNGPEISSLIKAGLARAREEGRIGGNPGLRARDPTAIKKVREARDAVHMENVRANLHVWLPIVQRMRPGERWSKVAAEINRKMYPPWTTERLRRTVRRLVVDGLAEPRLLGRSPRRTVVDTRLTKLVRAIATAGPSLTLTQIAAQLEDMGELTPRGLPHWRASSVKYLLDIGGGHPSPARRYKQARLVQM